MNNYKKEFNYKKLFKISSIFIATLIMFTFLPIQAHANGGVSYTPDMETLVHSGLPVWNIAKALNRDSCAPAHAIDDDINSSTYGTQHTPADLYNYPTTGRGGCGDITYDNLVTYYHKTWCDDNHFRVSYTLYFPKDGFSGKLGSLSLGHAHDFETIIVSWKKDNGLWYRDELIMSRHHYWRHQAWENTLSTNSDGSQEGNNLEHPVIFVGWAKHAMFNNEETRFIDLPSQYTDNEYRSRNHQLWSSFSLKEVNDDNWYGQKFKEYNWGDATPPTNLFDKMCSL